MAIVLLDGIEAPTEQVFQGWPDDGAPSTGLAKHCSVKVMQLVTKIEVVAHPRSAPLGDIEELLEHVVVTELVDGHQALQAGVHVAVECIVLKADDAVLVVRQLLELFISRGLWVRHGLGRGIEIRQLDLGPFFPLDDGRPATV